MPRQRAIDPIEEQDALDIRFHKKQGRPKKEDSDDDPRTALAVGTVEPPSRRNTRDSTGGSDKYTIYARALVANQGNIEKALAAAFKIPEEEALERMVELHAEIRTHSRSGISLQEMLERHDLTRETRLAIMREALFAPQAAVRLKAVEMLDEVDMTAKAARIGSTWDEIVRVAKDRAMKRKR